MLDPAIRDCLHQEILVQRFECMSDYTDEIYGDKVTMMSRVENKRSITTDASGAERVTNFLIFTEDEIGIRDRVWLPGTDTECEDDAEVPKMVFEAVDEMGEVSHYETKL